MAFEYEIVNHIAVLSEGSNGWQKELNQVSWNKREPKLDIRDWSADHSSMSKGVTLIDDEAHKLILGLQNALEED